MCIVPISQREIKNSTCISKSYGYLEHYKEYFCINSLSQHPLHRFFEVVVIDFF
jgi:hypothetical protein